jgi:hypothetical protein
LNLFAPQSTKDKRNEVVVYNSASPSPAVAILVAPFSAVSTSVVVREFGGTDPLNDSNFESHSIEPYEFAGLKLAGSGVK